MNRWYALVTATTIECASLILWLALTRANHNAQGILILALGELFETGILYAFAFRGRQGIPLQRLRMAAILLGMFSVCEVLLWIVWQALSIRFGLGASTIVLALLMHLKHHGEMSVVRNTLYRHDLLNIREVISSLFEALGATGWLYLVLSGLKVEGAIALILAITIEHGVGGPIIDEANRSDKLPPGNRPDTTGLSDRA